METEADEVTVIVISASGLQGKKPGRHKYSVIFGVGSKKYRTGIVKDPEGCPEWNEESVIHVTNNLDQVFFIVTEKEDVLGQINIPITSLPGGSGRNQRTALQPHKKCPNPKGELVYQCYVSNRRPANRQIIDTKSPSLSHKYKRERRGSTLSSLNKKFSKSINNLLSFAKSSNDEQSSSKSKSGLMFRSINSGLNSAGKLPVITNVTPNIALAKGGTRITITGQNLGFSKSDIVDLTICESDCVESIEYESSNKIYCTTQPTLSGKGDIILETESGGIGTLRSCFMFCDKLPEPGKNPFEDDNPFADDMDDDVTFVVGSAQASPEVQPKTLSVTKTPKRTASSSDIAPPTSPKTKKHFMKHLRHASEGHVLTQLKNGPVKGVPPAPVVPAKKVDELNAELERLRLENAALKQENKDMKTYIENLVTKVIQHCPEALEMENKYSSYSK